MDNKEVGDMMANKVLTQADSKLIYWLLHDSGISNVEISRKTKISEATISRIKQGATSMEAIKFGYAMELTNYAQILRSEEGHLYG